MSTLKCIVMTILIVVKGNESQSIIHENDLNFRIEAGSQTCFFEQGAVGYTMELFYQVLDGQHGDLDISFEVTAPNGKKILSDYKKSENSIILDMEYDGDYSFCMDNSYSLVNSKLVFVYVMIEEQHNNQGTANIVEEGEIAAKQEVLQWVGTYDNGDNYYIDVEVIANSLSRTLKYVAKARHLLDLYGAIKTRDGYLAFEDTFIVDIWSGFQISLMCAVGLLQVYMIKSLFHQPKRGLNC